MNSAISEVVALQPVASQSAASPLVSIGLPTYNRAVLLARAIDSLLAQTWSQLEIVISDNASTDSTQAVCEAYARRDPRIRYLRNDVNLGPQRNFLATLEQARGEYFMWLSDDDWLDRDYIAACADWLIAHPDTALAAGVSHGYRSGTFDRIFAPTEVEQDSGVARVLKYYATVADNSIFYGVMRREHALADPMRNFMGADWLFVAGLAYRGKLATLADVRVHRELGGTSASLLRIARVMKIPLYQVVFRFQCLAWNACAEVLGNHALYTGLSRSQRFLFAARIYVCLLVHKSIKENLRYFGVTVLRALLGEQRYQALRRRRAAAESGAERAGT
jgi:glycosyltransferase involved in cell wall biosynthesis